MSSLEESKDNSRDNRESLLSPANRTELDGRVQLDTLTRIEIIGYSLGHFQNDLCAACWFNYLLYFMKNVVFAGDPDSGFYAGIVLLSGQIADGLATPLVGIFSDRTNTRIGKRTPWYIFGFVLVTVCFIFIFQECLLCQWFDSTSKTLMIFYYTFFPAAFNVGWAAVQVAHMSLVPSLTLSRKTRDKLNNARNTFTYIANLWVLLFAFLVFLILDCDFEQFKVLSLGSLALGCATSAFFLFTVREAKLVAACKNLQKQLKHRLKYSIDSKNSLSDDECNKPDKKTSPMTGEATSPACDSNGGVTSDFEKWELSDDENGEVHMSSKNKGKKNVQVTNSNADEHVAWTHWFKLPSFYLYGFVYMGARLLVNVQSSLIIFYLQNVLGIDKDVDTFDHGLPIEFAIIPMIIYLSSSITSSVLKTVYEKIGRRRAFAIGAVAALIGAAAMMFMGPDTKFLMYPLTIIIGVGQSVILNTSISLIAEVVGGKGASGAFVFGAYSLLDKFANGAALYAVMNIKDVSKPENDGYVRICASIIPAAAVVFAWILVLVGKATDYDAGDAVIDDDDKHNRPSTDKIN